MIKEFISKHRFKFGFLVGFLAFPVCIAAFIALSTAYNMTIWSTVTIPFGEGSELIFHRKNGHPFLAEYHRKTELVHNGKHYSVNELVMNTGGRTKINFYEYRINGQRWIRAIDRFGEYLFCLSNGRSYSLARVKGITFRGPLNGEYFGTSYINNYLSTLEVRFGSEKGIRDARFDSKGDYIGTLRNLTYYPKKTFPEEKIQTMFE